MNFFQFPEMHTEPCPICGTKDQKDTILIPIYGTDDGNISEVRPTHLECVVKGITYYLEQQLIVGKAKH